MAGEKMELQYGLGARSEEEHMDGIVQEKETEGGPKTESWIITTSKD